ncbi:ADP-ribosylation factor 6-like isoform X2 [Gigantopelta aegis]|uniref:ADP-ribosylation factor 6-like isoform X2 n=1 Tax=Gigantopelta aegis TaxID=1735272 RepID=UPI001B88B7FC|nr:ADP-ribosylation factor 6-like isoform X2 [Gigantopelta aegis]
MGQSKSVPIKILVVGPVGAGKTYLVQSLLLGVNSVNDLEPTESYNVDIIKSRKTGFKYNVYDICGKPADRPYHKMFYDETQGVILVINCSDMTKMEDAKNDLDELVGAYDLDRIPILVVANKLDNHDEIKQDRTPKGIEDSIKDNFIYSGIF